MSELSYHMFGVLAAWIAILAVMIFEYFAEKHYQIFLTNLAKIEDLAGKVAIQEMQKKTTNNE